jgi:hypothetical protein
MTETRRDNVAAKEAVAALKAPGAAWLGQHAFACS